MPRATPTTWWWSTSSKEKDLKTRMQLILHTWHSSFRNGSNIQQSTKSCALYIYFKYLFLNTKWDDWFMRKNAENAVKQASVCNSTAAWLIVSELSETTLNKLSCAPGRLRKGSHVNYAQLSLYSYATTCGWFDWCPLIDPVRWRL